MPSFRVVWMLIKTCVHSLKKKNRAFQQSSPERFNVRSGFRPAPHPKGKVSEDSADWRGSERLQETVGLKKFD